MQIKAIKYSEYGPDSGKILFQDKIDRKKNGSKSQEVIAEGLLDLSILDKAPETHRGEISDGRYYDSKHEDIPRGSMNTEA